MDAATRKRWIADNADIEKPLEAGATLKNALARAASTIVGIMDDEDASPRLRYDAARFVIGYGLGETVASDQPWEALIRAVEEDVAAS